MSSEPSHPDLGSPLHVHHQQPHQLHPLQPQQQDPSPHPYSLPHPYAQQPHNPGQTYTPHLPHPQTSPEHYRQPQPGHHFAHPRGQPQPSQYQDQYQHQHLHQSVQQPSQQPSQDGSGVKLTRGTSCVLCQQRKVRCDKNKPCANCVKAGVECRVVPPHPPRRRRKKLQEKDLLERLKKYESLLNDNGVKFDPIGKDIRDDGEDGRMEDVDELENDFEDLKTDGETSASPSATSRFNKAGRKPFNEEFGATKDLLENSSDEDGEGGDAIHGAFDRMFQNQDGFPFILSGQTIPVADIHPPAIQILQLWQIYIDNINPLLKITHVPTVQAQIIQATSDLANAPKNIEALMFGIYTMALTSLDDVQVMERFNEPKKEMLGRYFAAVQQALVNANFMRVNDPICLQAFFLYLLAVRWFVDPRQIWCLIGMAVRMAHKMGLHRDPGGFGLPPFEIEARRRLWWNIVGYDRRIGEITGATITAISSGGDCKLPLNVNDSDLHIDGKESPTPHTGPTEMLFALTRMELSVAVASNSDRDAAKHNNPDKPSPSSSTATSSNPRNGPTVRLAGQEGSQEYTLEGFCAHIEGTYLTQCDPKIPLHFFTLTMTRAGLCKMRVMNFLIRLSSAEAFPLKEIERDSLFIGAIQMVEYDNVVYSSESLKPFRWYAAHYFPFPSYMFIVQELRKRVSGPDVERAWEAVARNYDLRGHLSNLHSPMHNAFSGYFIKAWERHENHQLSTGRKALKPYFIHVLQERAEQRRQARAENREMPDNEGISMPRPSFPTAAAQGDGQTPPNQGPPGQTMDSSPPDDTSDMDFSFLTNPYQDLGNYTNGGGPPGGGGRGGPFEGGGRGRGLGGPPMGGPPMAGMGRGAPGARPF